MNYTLVVYGAPYSTQASHSALRLAEALPAQGHRVTTVFFYHDGVHNGSSLMQPPQDEPHLLARWRALHADQQCELLVCVAAAVKRGIHDASEATRHGHEAHALEAPFELTGVGQLLVASQHSDRTVTFAP
ncbi:sulfurtransferase complex subunit TusD [Larsenimonas rhizosphaerae]|uniref:Sulfurtransferase complex subunit TusD n=1 Tax=Larsenimonas rhizosphaerae TaxID=2944682 RepID=A0AA42CTL0_9GAMM|nr:sulfurtransferase complex subunit TusD [Larsenimonas rhizosphaerae]MCX2523339.1 sulfurtransferase complex subunit TusD [Larsenimonas rhizosphaerae]